ncbi:hypothetical protein PLEOSDRAFT_164788 [Pleurotus ostreatus PC15]|uniref:Uncharacterized protein n=1 Tax=Pleurotus ostreatus (strain PC15) TaxID=1137138 RepID=A0A067P921_PLEO1|nr:hypothetical protein PLEOSDRAFT_164788 [Pleurotus ostreatus PC15]
MTFTGSVLLAFVFAAVVHAAGDKAQAKALGNSKDAAQACFGDATPFFLPGDPDKVSNCCIAPRSITWFDQTAQIGECCSPGQTWTGNQTTLEGGCCDGGQNWSQDKASGLGGCCAPSLVFVGDRATKTGGCCTAGMSWLNGKCAQPPPRPTCQDLADPVCGDTDDLGIQYGHCYILKFPDGTQLGSNHDGPAYAKDGFFKDIPFKVCRSTTDCALGEAVPTDGQFLLQDQMGRPENAKGTIGWVDNGAGGTHIKFNTNAAQAGVFEGIPACSGGKCFIRLRRIGATCPMPDHGLTFWPNPKVSMMISFTETACSGPDAPFVPVTSANPAGLLNAFRAPRPSRVGSNASPAAPVLQQASSSLVASATSARAQPGVEETGWSYGTGQKCIRVFLTCLYEYTFYADPPISMNA